MQSRPIVGQKRLRIPRLQSALKAAREAIDNLTLVIEEQTDPPSLHQLGHTGERRGVSRAVAHETRETDWARQPNQPRGRPTLDVKNPPG